MGIVNVTFPAIFKTRALLFEALIVLTLSVIRPGLGQDRAASSATQGLNLYQYTTELDRWNVAVAKLEAHPEAARTLRQGLPKHWAVDADGQRFEVPTEWLRADMEALEKDPKTRAARVRTMKSKLQAMRGEAEELSQASAGEASVDGRVHKSLSEILARREFRGVHGPSWWDRLQERFYRWLADVLDRLGHHLGGYPNITRVVFWTVLYLAAGALLIWMILRLLRPAASVRLGLGREGPPTSPWQNLAQSARQAAAAGDFREAIKLAYWSGIYRLEELGLWKVDQTRTHREYLRLLSRAQPQWTALAAVTQQFEFAWYAGRPSSARDFESTVSNLEELGCALRSTRAIERS